MKTKIETFLLICGIVLAGATLAPVKPLPPPPPSGDPGPVVFECPTLSSPLDHSTARLSGAWCIISCHYENGSGGNILKRAPQGVCEATETGAIYD